MLMLLVGIELETFLRDRATICSPSCEPVPCTLLCMPFSATNTQIEGHDSQSGCTESFTDSCVHTFPVQAKKEEGMEFLYRNPTISYPKSEYLLHTTYTLQHVFWH